MGPALTSSRPPTDKPTGPAAPGPELHGPDASQSDRPQGQPPGPHPGRWDGTASQPLAFRHGLQDCASIPGLILLTSSAGFGALAEDAGFSLINAAFMMAVFYALPAQVVMVDQLARGASIVTGTFSVLLTAVRMVPMVVSLMPELKAPRRHWWRQVLAVHGIAVTGWIEGMRRVPLVPADYKLTYYLGLAWGLILVTVIGTIAGFTLAGSLPPLASAVLLFLTPIYFLLSMMATARTTPDWLPIVFGCASGPVFHVVSPELDLALTGLIGGGAAYLVGRRLKAKEDAL